MEISHRMRDAVKITRQFTDEELRRRANDLVTAPQPPLTQVRNSRGWGQVADESTFTAWRDGIELGVVLWRLLEKSARLVEVQVDLREAEEDAERAELALGQVRRELASLQELADQQATLLTGYREALANITDDAPHNGTETSQAAARSIAPRMNPMRILAALLRAAPYGLTAQEIEQHTGMTGNSIRPRLVEMATLTWVSRGPEVRATKSGRDAAVWHITQAGDNAFTAAAHEASTTPS